MTDELKNPSDYENRCGGIPQTMNKKARQCYQTRDNDQWNSERMTRTIDRMLMTPSVFFDPLIPGFAVERTVHALHLSLNTRSLKEPLMSRPKNLKIDSCGLDQFYRILGMGWPWDWRVSWGETPAPARRMRRIAFPPRIFFSAVGDNPRRRIL
jgi:hypothetical protein